MKRRRYGPDAYNAARYLAELRGSNRWGIEPPTAPCVCGCRVLFLSAEAPGWRCQDCDIDILRRSWRAVPCRHDPPCEPPEHSRSSVGAWYILPPGVQP
jgi:hypothetical protein